MKYGFNRNIGFTIIELLIVVSIIGLLSSIVLVSVRNVVARARDAQRLSDVSQISRSLEIYYLENYNFPARTADACCDGWDQGPCDGNEIFIDGLVSSGTVGLVPVDPTSLAGTGCYGYNYYRYGAGSHGCDVSKGAFYVLGIRDMESSGRPHPESPGWSCSGRNWQNEFDWVTGAFEY